MRQPVLVLAVPRVKEVVITAARPGIFVVTSVSHTFADVPEPGDIAVELIQVAKEPQVTDDQDLR